MRATQGKIRRDDVEIYWWLTAEDADAPLVVFTHGGAMDHRMWKAQVGALSSEYRVLTYDVRGHGCSRCPGDRFGLEAASIDLLALLDAQSAHSAVLVGHSFGATISQLVALQHPDRVCALVGIGAVCATMPTTTTARMRQATNPLALRVLGRRRVRAMFADMAGATSHVRDYAREAIGAVDEDVFEAIMRTGFGRPVAGPPDYRLGVPLLLLQGEKEPYRAFMGTTERWVARDGARLVVVPGAAHNANQDAPDFVNGEIRAFLASRDNEARACGRRPARLPCDGAGG